MFVSFYNLSKL